MTVGGLAAHLVRAAGATVAYLDRTPVDAQPEDDLLTPVTYFHAALDSPIHDQVKRFRRMSQQSAMRRQPQSALTSQSSSVVDSPMNPLTALLERWAAEC